MANNKPTTIGSHTIIQIPKGGIKDVPAKVDTGADSSSIWASSISEDNGRLSYCLFDKGSKYFNAQAITTKDYKIKTVRNSFGHTENRYSVKLPVSIEGRTIKVTFTLADRSQNRYPVLIGRRTLQGKFLVDVSRRSKKSHSKSNILVLGSKPSKKLDEFLKDVATNLKTPGANFVLRSYNDLAFIIDPSGLKVIETPTGKDISQFDLVYFKSHKRSYPQAIALASYLKYCNINFFDQEITSHTSYDKLSEYVTLAAHGLSVPASLCSSSEFLAANHKLLTDKSGWPIVCKEINSDRGKKNFLVQNAKELKNILKRGDPGDLFILQEFIPSNGYLRAFVMGSEVPLIIFRAQHLNKNPLKAHLNNPAGSHNAKLLEAASVDSSVKNTAVLAAKVMNRQLAGADLIMHRDSGRWYLLEVNSAPQLRSGSFLEEKRKAFADFIDNELNR